MIQRNSIDGFGVRRRAQNSNVARQRPSLANGRGVPDRFLIDPSRKPASTSKTDVPMLVRTAGPASSDVFSLPQPKRDPIALNLDLDDPESKNTDVKNTKNKKNARGKLHRKWSRKKIILSVVGVLAICLLTFAGYFVYKFLTTGGKIFKGNVITALFDQAKPLKQDENGRSNILLFGTSEDDPGHPGGDLTDSIMVVSTNQKTHETFLVSIPRDLHVNYGKACVSGYQGKVNVVYSCTKDNGSEDEASAALRTKIGEVLGLDIQYSAHVNYTVLRQAVDAVGGITVNITSDDPRGILDRNFDWDCPKGGQTCYNVKYPIGPANLDGKHALYLARARGDDPLGRTYGLGRSNPDREDNQRKILIALKDKAASAGVLTNPVAVNNLLDALGDNLRTNFDAAEIKTLLELAKNTKNDNITSFTLEDTDHPLATASCFGGDICPNAGPTNFSAIQAAVHALALGNTASLEYAKIDVLNASGTPGSAQTQADKLGNSGFTIRTIGNAPTSLGTKPLAFYDLTGGKKSATLAALKKQLGVDVTPGVPAGITSNADFVVIVGVQSSNNSGTQNSQ